MSTKTIKQRIAVVAVSALTAGLLSVIATPAANAATGTLVGRVYENITSDGAAVVSATTGANGSQGLISIGAATAGAQTVSMYSNGIIVVATAGTADKAQSITVSGGGLLTGAAGAGSAKCFQTGGGTISYTGSTVAELADAAGASTNTLFCAINATKPGTAITITGDNDTTTSNATDWVITVNVLNSAYNAANGAAYVNSATNTSQRSQGVIAWGTGTGLSQTATMYANGTLSTQTALVGSSLAQKITVTGGTLAGADKCLAGGSGTLAVASDLVNCSVTADAASQLFASFKPSAAGTALIITGYNDATTAGYVASWKITVTVVAAGSAGTFSASESSIALTAGGGAPATANVDDPGANVVANTACVELYYSANDALGLPLAGSSIIAKGSNSAMALTIGGATGTLPIVTGTYSTATYISVCQNAANVNKAVTGTVTLTVDGVDVATRTVLITGQLATITVVKDAISVRGDAGTDNAIYGDFAARNAGTWVPSHSFTAKDAAGNLVAATVSIDTTTLDAQVIGLSADNGAADPLNADPDLRVGGLTFSCADTSGENTKLKVKATAADTTTIYSNAFTVTCAGNAVNYKASTDKAVYNTGDVMTVTVTGTDKSGKPANDYGIISTTAKLGTIASGAIASSVSAPADGNTLSAGSKTYKYIIGQTPGTYTIAVDFPVMNSTTYSQTALTLPVSVASATTTVSNADVLKSIVALIASINKQIQALQKLILKR
jgi:hypothetical protein